jgi:hypothetical protein
MGELPKGARNGLHSPAHARSPLIVLEMTAGPLRNAPERLRAHRRMVVATLLLSSSPLALVMKLNTLRALQSR